MLGAKPPPLPKRGRRGWEARPTCASALARPSCEASRARESPDLSGKPGRQAYKVVLADRYKLDGEAVLKVVGVVVAVGRVQALGLLAAQWHDVLQELPEPDGVVALGAAAIREESEAG